VRYPIPILLLSACGAWPAVLAVPQVQVTEPVVDAGGDGGDDLDAGLAPEVDAGVPIGDAGPQWDGDAGPCVLVDCRKFAAGDIDGACPGDCVDGGVCNLHDGGPYGDDPAPFCPGAGQEDDQWAEDVPDGGAFLACERSCEDADFAEWEECCN
jgi:hypothetical protein